MKWIDYFVSILPGLAVAIPLVIQLVKYVSKSIKEKNWSKLLELIMGLMADAETMFDKGADRKAYVLEKVRASANTINYDVDLNIVSDLIDSLCEVSKVVNAIVIEEVV